LPFPGVVQPVDLVEFDCSVDVDQVGEHATPTHGGELAGIPNQDDDAGEARSNSVRASRLRALSRQY
jgi:hypothetical protein